MHLPKNFHTNILERFMSAAELEELLAAYNAAKYRNTVGRQIDEETASLLEDFAAGRIAPDSALRAYSELRGDKVKNVEQAFTKVLYRYLASR